MDLLGQDDIISNQRGTKKSPGLTALTGLELFVNLILMPILASIFGVCAFLVPILVGCAMVLRRTTVRNGKAVLIYAVGSLLVGLACVWMGFALMLVGWEIVPFTPAIETASILLFWASGPLGILVGVFLAHRFMKRARR